ncbi:hypothetical protein PR048_031522 [Dryococelus australis]|uniref:Uncharacterized protein n=1 Tax=Dryococelus australis TaxID=614101 RepID=A0ABQ9G9J8_9NEOP|nr:hypothetical protein PR048_031522 [Dryococelus australis]
MSHALTADIPGCIRRHHRPQLFSGSLIHYLPKINWAPIHNVCSVVVTPLESRRATSCGYNNSHPVRHALYECLQSIHGDSSPFLLQPFHELSNAFVAATDESSPGDPIRPKDWQKEGKGEAKQHISPTPAAERLACSPPTKAIRVQSPAGSLRIFACGNRAGRCRWSADFLEDLTFPPPFHSGAAPYSLQSPSSALKTSMLRAVQISSLSSFTFLPGGEEEGNDNDRVAIVTSKRQDCCSNDFILFLLYKFNKYRVANKKRLQDTTPTPVLLLFVVQTCNCSFSGFADLPWEEIKLIPDVLGFGAAESLEVDGGTTSAVANCRYKSSMRDRHFSRCYLSIPAFLGRYHHIKEHPPPPFGRRPQPLPITPSADESAGFLQRQWPSSSRLRPLSARDFCSSEETIPNRAPFLPISCVAHALIITAVYIGIGNISRVLWLGTPEFREKISGPVYPWKRNFSWASEKLEVGLNVNGLYALVSHGGRAMAGPWTPHGWPVDAPRSCLYA